MPILQFQVHITSRSALEPIYQSPNNGTRLLHEETRTIRAALATFVAPTFAGDDALVLFGTVFAGDILDDGSPVAEGSASFEVVEFFGAVFEGEAVAEDPVLETAVKVDLGVVPSPDDVVVSGSLDGASVPELVEGSVSGLEDVGESVSVSVSEDDEESVPLSVDDGELISVPDDEESGSSPGDDEESGSAPDDDGESVSLPVDDGELVSVPDDDEESGSAPVDDESVSFPDDDGESESELDGESEEEEELVPEAESDEEEPF
jgi:hypothetical protein